MKNQLNTKMKSLRTDRGHEYVSNVFKLYCDDKGIIRKLTIPYTMQQNSREKEQNTFGHYEINDGTN